MNKPVLLFRAPVKSVSGYGSHSRDILRALYELNIFDIRIDSCIWGATPLTALNKNDKFHQWIESNIVTRLDMKPEYYIQVTVPNEFMTVGNCNIGITAGIETTAAPKDWVDGCNRMDLVITTSKFSKEVLMNSIYHEKDKATDRILNVLKIEKAVEVLFEGIDVEVYNNRYSGIDLDIKEDFCFLFVGHWLRGNLGEDRKDVGMLIKCFLEAFKDDINQPALVLKTSSASFSVKEREFLRRKIQELSKGIKNPAPIYLLFGNLTDHEMNQLYNHPKIKSMISLTKGEGFGRPLLEFTMTGKPLIASNWSGHKDFLPTDKSILLGGEVKDVHDSAIDKFIIKNSKWFTVNYPEAINTMKIVRDNYDSFLPNSQKLMMENKEKFSLEEMKKSLHSILLPFLNQPLQHKIKLPVLTKID